MKDQRRVVRNEQRQRPIVQDGFDLDVIARQDMQALGAILSLSLAKVGQWKS